MNLGNNEILIKRILVYNKKGLGMSKRWIMAIFVIVLVFGVTTNRAQAGNGIPGCRYGGVTDDVVDISTNIVYSMYVPSNVGKCKDLIFVFHGWGASEDDYNGMPLYYLLKQGLYKPNAYVCFVSKGSGSWANNIEKADLSSFIKSIVRLAGVSRVHYIGYSQGVYDASYISSAYNKWTNALLIDGGDFSKNYSKSFNYVVWVAGYDSKSYLEYDDQQYVDEYYEPMCKEIFTSAYIFHLKSAVFGLTDDAKSKYFDENVSGYYDYPCIDGVSILLTH